MIKKFYCIVMKIIMMRYIILVKHLLFVSLRSALGSRLMWLHIRYLSEPTWPRCLSPIEDAIAFSGGIRV